ncbi:MAG: hypothetical protein KDB27_19125 [Planctomycetales bacterium]|nr:hypothetical protein [Planctomycetales bacterium]
MERQFSILQTVVLAGFWALVVATLPLWIGGTSFPAVPFVEVLVHIPIWVDQSLLAALAIASLWTVWKQRRTAPRMLTVAFLVAMILLNQHRFQPWAYLTAVQLVVLSSKDHRLSFRLLRMVCVAVYLFSAISKVDHVFFHHLGERLVDTSFDLLGMNPHLMAVENKRWMVWALPLGEFLVGLGLCWPYSRQWAVGLAIVLHATLFTILGPFGLNHHVGVLMWNVLFAVEVVLLFGFKLPSDDEVEPETRGIFDRIAVAICALCCALPVFEITGSFDHWPAWSLYSDRREIVELLVENDEAVKLPGVLIRHLGPPQPFQSWRRLYLEQYSLDETRAPIYPEDRFQIAVAAQIVRDYDLGNEDGRIKLIVRELPNRRTGERTTAEYVGRKGIQESLQRFRLNTTARTLLRE